MDPIEQLIELRKSFEHETGRSVADLEINMACVLYDVAKFLQLSRDQTRELLGTDAYSMITEGRILHVNGQRCPFGAQCSLTECLMEDCPRFGERFVTAFGCDHQEAADG